MKALTRQQSRDVDRRAIEQLGMSSLVLMENAGRGVVDVLLGFEPKPRTVIILCGKGNNGGDGFVVARHLAIRNIGAKVVLLAAPADLTGDARANFEILERIHVPILDLSSTRDLAPALDAFALDANWIADCLLGTGAVGEPREPYRTAIHWVNRQQAKVLAVDVPSGLDCDTGQPADCTVRADMTCTFHTTKVGFAEPIARDFVGALHVVSIGITADF